MFLTGHCSPVKSELKTWWNLTIVLKLDHLILIKVSYTCELNSKWQAAEMD